MKQNAELDEVTIQTALEKGLITPQEARVMLTVYLKKYNFKPIQNQIIQSQPSLNVHRL